MATLSFSFNTGSFTLADINNQLGVAWGYQSTVPDPDNPGQMINNPQTKAQFNTEHIRQEIIRAYLSGKQKTATDAAIASVTGIVLT